MTVDTGFVPASLLLRPPSVRTVARNAARYDGIRSIQKHQWTARFTFPQYEQTATPRDRFGLLFVQLQLSNPTLQLLPFSKDSTNNTIPAAKNLPYDGSLDIYLKTTENQSPTARNLPIYVRISSTKQSRTIKSRVLPYLCTHNIFMQKTELPSANLIISAWLFQSYPEYSNRAQICQRMIHMLGGFDKFQIAVKNQFRPVPHIPSTTRAWIVGINQEEHQDKFSDFLETFHAES